MTHTISLPANLHNCPTCWQNFIRDFNDKWEQLDYHTELCDTTKEVCHFDDANTELKTKWNAQLDGDIWDQINGIQFDSEKDAILFMLRWS